MDEARCVESYFDVYEGTPLFTRTWDVPNARARILIVHGYGEHSGRYGHIARRLNAAGYSVHAYDQCGHGKSHGLPGQIFSVDALVDDLEAFVDHVHPEPPFVLMGHSMGSLILAHYVLRCAPQTSGLVFSSGVLKVNDDVSPLLKSAAGFIASYLPRLPVRTIDPADLSHDAEVVAAYATDPLVYHGKMLARTGYELMVASESLEKRLADMTLPFIALHGTDDRIVPCSASKALYERAQSKDKTLRLYEGAFHEVFNDSCSEAFMTDLVDWIGARV